MLEALQEIAFNPQFLPVRIEKERKAVMAEAQVTKQEGDGCLECAARLTLWQRLDRASHSRVPIPACCCCAADDEHD